MPSTGALSANCPDTTPRNAGARAAGVGRQPPVNRAGRQIAELPMPRVPACLNKPPEAAYGAQTTRDCIWRSCHQGLHMALKPTGTACPPHQAARGCIWPQGVTPWPQDAARTPARLLAATRTFATAAAAVPGALTLAVQQICRGSEAAWVICGDDRRCDL